VAWCDDTVAVVELDEDVAVSALNEPTAPLTVAIAEEPTPAPHERELSRRVHAACFGWRAMKT
jgi:hypothetical protein